MFDAEPVVARDFHGVDLARQWRHTIEMVRHGVESHYAAGSPSRYAALRPVRRPVFVLGCPRSGTTFLGDVLSALPSATYLFEPPIFKYYSRRVYEGSVPAASARRMYRAGLRVLLAAAPGAGPRLIEKNPNHTWIAPFLLETFPDASFVIITRDGRDTTTSLLEKPWHLAASAGLGKREPGGYRYGPYPHFYIEGDRGEEFRSASDLRRCAWIWRRHVEEGERLRDVLPSHAQHHLRYEDLLLEPERSLAELLDFLQETGRSAFSRTLAVVAQGHTRSIGRWRDRLTPAQLVEFDGEAGEAMRLLNYA